MCYCRFYCGLNWGNGVRHKLVTCGDYSSLKIMLVIILISMAWESMNRLRKITPAQSVNIYNLTKSHYIKNCLLKAHWETYLRVSFSLDKREAPVPLSLSSLNAPSKFLYTNDVHERYWWAAVTSMIAPCIFCCPVWHNHDNLPECSCFIITVYNFSSW